MRQLLVERYKRNLFDWNSSPGDLKTEIHKLASGTGDVVLLLSEASEGSSPQPRMLQKALAELAGVMILDYFKSSLVNLNRVLFDP